MDRTSIARPVLAAALALAPALVPIPASAQVADENMWVTDGTVREILRTGNWIYVGGQFDHVGPAAGCGVPLDVASGAPVPNFPKVVGEVYSVISDGAGGWYLGGDFTAVGGKSRSRLAHVQPDGSVSPWDPNANHIVYALARSGSTVFAGGLFSRIGVQDHSNLVALDATTGAIRSWSPFASGGVRSLALSGTTLYAGGDFNSINGVPRSSLGAVDAATGVLSSWISNPQPDGQVRALAVSGTTLYAGGAFTIPGRADAAAWSTTTGALTAWDPLPSYYVNALVVSGSIVYVGGDFINLGGQPRLSIGAVSASTGTATTWNPIADGNARVQSLIVDGGIVYAGGEFTTMGGQPRNNIAALDAVTGAATAWNPNIANDVKTLAMNGSTIYAGGEITIVGGYPRRNLVRFDATTGMVDLGWIVDPNGTVMALAMYGSRLYVGGYFTTMASLPRNHFAAFHSDDQLFDWSWDVSGIGAYVSDIAVELPISVGDPARVYVAGRFTSVDGQARNNLAVIDPVSHGVASWNPNADQEVRAIRLRTNLATGVVTSIYAGGYFTNVGGQPRNYVAELTPTGVATAWNPIPCCGRVSALLRIGNTVYVGGVFQTIAGVARRNLAAIDATTGIATGFDPGPEHSIEALAFAGSIVYAGGDFHNIGGERREYLAALDPATGAATAWNPSAGTRVAPTVYALMVSGTTVYAGGAFWGMGRTPQAHIAAIPTQAALDAPPPVAISRIKLTGAPNPAAVRATLSFTLPAPGLVRLQLFDATGQRVATLIDREWRAAGRHEVPFATRGLAPGLYFGRLDSGFESETTRLIVMR